MNETSEENTQTTKLKVDVSDVVIATTAVVMTIGALRVGATLVYGPLKKLTKKLEKKNEDLKTK